jgi:hypothetical protein
VALSAAFTINGSSPTGGIAVAASSVVTLAVTSLTGVQTVVWEIVGNDNSARTNPTITAAGSPNGATASFTMPADIGDGLGQCYIVKCTVSDGGTPISSVSSTGVVGVNNPLGVLPLAYGEETERSATHGWVHPYNKLMAGNPRSYASVSTTDATVTTVLTIPVDSNTTVSFGARWFGRLNGGTTQAMRESTFVMRRIGAGPVQWGSTNDVFSTAKDDATWGALDFTVSGNDVIIRVTGKAATNIDWKCACWTTVL